MWSFQVLHNFSISLTVFTDFQVTTILIKNLLIMYIFLELCLLLVDDLWFQFLQLCLQRKVLFYFFTDSKYILLYISYIPYICNLQDRYLARSNNNLKIIVCATFTNGHPCIFVNICRMCNLFQISNDLENISNRHGFLLNLICVSRC